MDGFFGKFHKNSEKKAQESILDISEEDNFVV